MRRAFFHIKRDTTELQTRRETLVSLRKLPESLPEVIELIERLWPDRIVFVDRAKTSAKRAGLNSARAEIGEAWRCLWSMSTDLHELLFSGADLKGDVAQNFRERTGFELTMTEGKQTKSDKKLMKLRRIKYEGAEVDITPHVKYGKKPPRVFGSISTLTTRGASWSLGIAGITSIRTAPSGFDGAAMRGLIRK